MITIKEIHESDIIPLSESLPKWGYRFKDTTKEIWLRRFDIWWTSNPAFTSQIPRGWILIENDTKLVGFIGNIPVKFLIYGEPRIAVAAIDWFVDPSVRGIFSIRLFKEYLTQKYADLFLFNTRQTKIIKILTKFKFIGYSLPPTQTIYLYIIKRTMVDKNFLISLFFGRLTHFSDFLGLITRFVTVALSYIYQKPVMRYDDRQGKEYTTSLCSFCDDSFSRIWESYQASCDIVLSRDTKTLNWMYFSSFSPNKRVVIQCRKSSDNCLVGYMVFDIMWKIWGSSSKVGIMQLQDMCIENDDPKVLTSLISFAIEIGKKNNAALLELWANSQKTDSYLRRTFMVRKPVSYHRFIKIADSFSVNLNSLKVCPSFIAPPHVFH